MKDSEKIQEAKSLLTELKHAWVPQDVESTNAHARKIEALEYVIRQAERVNKNALHPIATNVILQDLKGVVQNVDSKYYELSPEDYESLVLYIEDLVKRLTLGQTYIDRLHDLLKGAEPNENQS